MVADNPYQLHLLNHIKGWRNHPARKACYLTELWPKSFDCKHLVYEPFQDYDHIFVGLSHAVPVLKEKLGVSCSYLPVGVDTDMFSQTNSNHDRPIDIAYIGRRVESVHEELLELCDEDNLFYFYDTASKLRVDDHAQHRRLYADILKRSKCAIAFPAKMNLDGYTKCAAEIGWRYYEFAAAGSMILGKAPDNEFFNTYFGWKDSVIDIGDDNLRTVVNELLSDQVRQKEIAQNNRVQSMLKNDWVYRWLEILNRFSIQPSEATLARVDRLQLAAS